LLVPSPLGQHRTARREGQGRAACEIILNHNEKGPDLLIWPFSNLAPRDGLEPPT